MYELCLLVLLRDAYTKKKGKMQHAKACAAAKFRQLSLHVLTMEGPGRKNLVNLPFSPWMFTHHLQYCVWTPFGKLNVVVVVSLVDKDSVLEDVQLFSLVYAPLTVAEAVTYAPAHPAVSAAANSFEVLPLFESDFSCSKPVVTVSVFFCSGPPGGAISLCPAVKTYRNAL